MNNANKLLFVAIVLAAGTLYIQANLSQKPLDQLLKTDIVYFDGLEVFGKSDEVKEAKKNLEVKFQAEGNNLQNLRKDAEKAALDLQNMGSVATEQARRTKQEEALEKANKAEVKERSLQQYAQQEMQRAEYEMAQKLKDYATQVAKKEGYSLVLAGGVAYAENKLNISEKIVVAWNNDYATAAKSKVAHAAKAA